MKNSKELRTFKREMKSKPTFSERIFNERLKKAGFEFKTQIIVGFYILDFVIPNRMLCIEIDGSSHEGREEYDSRRDAFLERCGFTVMHIRNEDVRTFNMANIAKFKGLGLQKFRSALSKGNSLRGQAMLGKLV